MRIRLDLVYVLLRSCDLVDGERQWVCWCPELDILAWGSGPDNALWSGREAARATVENCVMGNTHPMRRRCQQRALEDEAGRLYQRFRKHYRGPSDYEAWGTWTTVLNAADAPESIDTLFVPMTINVETRAGHCLVNEDDTTWISLYYKSGGTTTVRCLVETTFALETARLPPADQPIEDEVARIMGVPVHAILERKDDV